MMKSNAGVKRILVVEDEPTVNEVCRKVLTRDGFEVDTAVNGEVAQRMLREGDYDLILMDIKMPGMDGREFFGILKARYPKLAGRVIFATGDVIGGDTKEFLDQSGRPVLTKPFTPDELKAIVRAALG
ncbi:MAG: response regulator [Dehalococcoidales bacterium]|nr:response regulator [Dehalococcoidales bacterium]